MRLSAAPGLRSQVWREQVYFWASDCAGLLCIRVSLAQWFTNAVAPKQNGLRCSAADT